MKRSYILFQYLLFICIIFMGCSSKTSPINDITTTASPTLDVVTTKTVSQTPDVVTTPAASPTPEVEKIITIDWEFEVSYDDENFDIPKTKVYLVRNGESNTREYIGEYIGSLENYSLSDDNWGFPESSIIACFGWYAGSGDLLCVVREEPGLLNVKHKVIAESGGDPEIEKELDNYTFENILSIQIDEEAFVQALNIIEK